MKPCLKVLAAMFAALAVSYQAQAGPITLYVGAGGTSGLYILGEVIGPYPDGGQEVRDSAMITTILRMTPGVRTGGGVTAGGLIPEYYRSTTDFGSLPEVASTGYVLGTGIAEGAATYTITLPVNTTFAYLIARYDGKTGGSQVWYLGNAPAGTTGFVIPRYATPDPDFTGNGGALGDPGLQNLLDTGTQYKISDYTLFNPTTVPDGGTTAVLLGLAVLGLGFLRRLRG